MGLSDLLGISDDFHAQQAKTDPSAYQWQGPSQGELAGLQQGSQQQSANDYGQQQNVNQAQSAYLQQLQNAASGNGPSQAQAVLQQGANRAGAQAMSLARSMNNGNPAQQAAAMRAAQQQGAGAMVGAGAQAAQIKAQEQQSALGMMGGALGQQRGQDLQSMGMGNQMTGQYLGAAMGAANSQLGANMNQQELNSSNFNAAQGINAGVASQNAQANQAVLGAGLSAAGGMMAMSDARAKEDVQQAGAPQDGPSWFGGHVGNGLSAAGAGLLGRQWNPKQAQPPRAPGYSPNKAEDMIRQRMMDTRPPMHPTEGPAPSLDEVMAQSAGGPPPVNAQPMMAPPAWANFGGAPQDAQSFAMPASAGGMPGGLAIAMPPRAAPPPYVPSDIRGKEDVAPGGPPMPMPIAQAIGSDKHMKEEAFRDGRAAGLMEASRPSPTAGMTDRLAGNPAAFSAYAASPNVPPTVPMGMPMIHSDEDTKTSVAGKVHGSGNFGGGISRVHPSEGTKSGQRSGGDMTEADHFLAHLTPYTYKYKDPSNEPTSEPNGGRYLGVMAQNVEQAPEIGRQIVKDTPRGKVLEGGALMSAMAGGLGRLHERVSQLEGGNGVRRS